MLNKPISISSFNLQALLDEYTRTQKPINNAFRELLSSSLYAYQNGELTQAELFNLVMKGPRPASTDLYVKDVKYNSTDVYTIHRRKGRKTLLVRVNNEYPLDVFIGFNSIGNLTEKRITGYIRDENTGRLIINSDRSWEPEECGRAVIRNLLAFTGEESQI